MKYLRLLFILVLTTSLLSAGNTAHTPAFEKDKILMQVMHQILNRYHYKSVDINDAFSRQVFKDYLKQLDYSKKYFLKEDIESLEQYKTQIDEEFKGSSLNFFRLALQLFKNQLVTSKSIYEEILSKPFDFTKHEQIELDPEKLDYVSTQKQQQERWRKILKYKTLVRLADKIKNQERKKKNNPDYEAVSRDTLEARARKGVLKSQQSLYDRIMELDHQDHLTRYLNAISGIYDPHTSYFPPKDKENFDISMSGSFEGIGATLQKKDGYIKVIRIVVGSACWRQGDLEVGDLIMKVAQGDKEPVNVMDMPLDEAVQLIRGPKGTEVRLTVKKRDGTIEVIPIIRDVVELRETYAKAAVIEDGPVKTGYIKLPKFYVDFNKTNGRSCYKDIKKQIKQLKKRNVKGLILDLRNNGGGSLEEVVKIAGLFIDKGPIVQVKDQIKGTEVYKDEEPGILFKKPLIVMVNNFSASASEIMAAAMQDYDRGIVTGSSSTYGKGTVQRFISFDKALPKQLQMFTPLGSLKITIQKFYRINGSATQVKGIIPDIEIPDKYTFMEIGEKERENAMEWDKIEPAEYEKWEPDYNTSRVMRKSQKRIEKNKQFNLVKEEARNIKKKSEISHYSLHLETFMKRQKELQEAAKKFDKLKNVETDFQVELFKPEDEEIAQDSAEIVRRKKWHKKVKNDLYVEEAVNIMGDIL